MFTSTFIPQRCMYEKPKSIFLSNIKQIWVANYELHVLNIKKNFCTYKEPALILFSNIKNSYFIEQIMQLFSSNFKTAKVPKLVNSNSF